MVNPKPKNKRLFKINLTSEDCVSDKPIDKAMKNMASIYSISRLLPVDHLDDYPFCHRIGFSCRTKNIHNKKMLIEGTIITLFSIFELKYLEIRNIDRKTEESIGKVQLQQTQTTIGFSFSFSFIIFYLGETHNKLTYSIWYDNTTEYYICMQKLIFSVRPLTKSQLK